jgi:hypothetical protein
MLFRTLLALLFAVFAALPAQAEEPAKGPVMGEMLKHPKYIYAWQGMMSGETPPPWIRDYVTTLDGPPVPTIPVSLDGETYTLGFTCKPNECEDNQLYVLFAPEGRAAWAMLVAPEGVSWLGRPEERIQKAITSGLRK